MTPFFILLVMSLILAVLWMIDRPRRGPYYWTLALLLLLFSGLRDGVGTDFDAYNTLYDNVLSGWISSEWGFVAISAAMQYLGLGFPGVIFLIAALTVVAATLAIDKFEAGIHGLVVYLTVPLFYLLSLNTIRQTLAAAVFMLAAYFGVRGKKLLFLAMVALASNFHISAVMMAPLILLLGRRPSLMILLASIVVGYVAAINIRIIAQSLGFHEVYLEPSDSSAASQFILCLVASSYFIWNRNTLHNSRFDTAPLVNLLCVATGICAASLFTSVAAEFILRMTTYCTWAIAILAPVHIMNLRSRANRGAGYALLYIGCIAYFTHTIFKGESIDLVPYQTILGSI